MPDGSSSVPVSLRVPADLLDKLARIAAILERPRSWVILQALRSYLADQGQEILDIEAGIAEYERGEYVTAEELHAGLDARINRTEAKRSSG
jgi:predicted transcriptional regulator